MSKNRGKQFATREEWLAVRDSRSMGQTLRARERPIHSHEIVDREIKTSDGAVTKVKAVRPSIYRKPKEV